jgi:hypothetical protein
VTLIAKKRKPKREKKQKLTMEKRTDKKTIINTEYNILFFVGQLKEQYSDSLSMELPCKKHIKKLIEYQLYQDSINDVVSLINDLHKSLGTTR